ncbi:hypothetical protein AQ611_20080 [Burkholderia singularis]|nr:hypothetical protein AQ611_20080 [Burkholderia sp. Bp7605]
MVHVVADIDITPEEYEDRCVRAISEMLTVLDPEPQLFHQATDLEAANVVPCSRIMPMMLRLPAELRLSTNSS